MRVLLSALLCSVWLIWDSRNVANAVRQKIAKCELLLQQSRGSFQPLQEQITHVLSHSFSADRSYYIFFLPIDGSTESPVAGGLCGSHPGCLFRVSVFKGCSFIVPWKWRQFGVLHGLVLNKTFFVFLLETGWKIVTDLVDLDGGPFLSQLKAELLWNQLFLCSAKLRTSTVQFNIEVKLHF